MRLKCNYAPPFLLHLKKKKTSKVVHISVRDWRLHTHTSIHPTSYTTKKSSRGKSLLFKNLIFIFIFLLLLCIPSGVTRQKKNKKKIPEARGAPFCSVRLCGLLLLVVGSSTANDCDFRIPTKQQERKKKKEWAANWRLACSNFKLSSHFKTCSKQINKKKIHQKMDDILLRRWIISYLRKKLKYPKVIRWIMRDDNLPLLFLSSVISPCRIFWTPPFLYCRTTSRNDGRVDDALEK